MKNVQADSISAAFQKVQDLISEWHPTNLPDCWFRGSNDTTLSLKPGAYWRSGYVELDVLVPFAQEGVSFADVGGIDEWDTYYLAQHHRIPTRLLDWTESFGAALFFAFDGWDTSTTPCIWVMQPYLLNEMSIGWDGILAPENNPAINSWLPRRIAEPNHILLQDVKGYPYDNDLPLAIYPRKTNTRISAQQGMFTIHGRDKDSLPDIVRKKESNIADVFAKIDLVDFDVKSVLVDLRRLGIRRSTVYPDINNFVLDLKEQYEWK